MRAKELRQLNKFEAGLQPFFVQQHRMMPWRSPKIKPDTHGVLDPYAILVSEMMLQQTQVRRVVPKYEAFMARFPTMTDVATAQLADVLKLWQGLGYNRRAKYLWQAAQLIVQQYKGQFPQTIKELQTLPGIGPNTAGAILAYAYNQPVQFIETNIRTVYIHHFFEGKQSIPDKSISTVLGQTLNKTNPREFYWALMDYGTFLKPHIGNLSRSSHSYTKQTAFHGSKRQLRGQILTILSSTPNTRLELHKLLADERLDTILNELTNEQLISRTSGRYVLG